MKAMAEIVEVNNAPTVEKTREIINDELRRDLGEWMMAKEDLVWRPAVQLTEESAEFAARFVVPGLHPEDVEVLVTPERLLIRGKGQQLLRSVEFPRPVNPDKVRADITDGILCVRARRAEPGNVVMFKPRAA
jgi:HSP20 family molecular chaperone IbpA